MKNTKHHRLSVMAAASLSVIALNAPQALAQSGSQRALLLKEDPTSITPKTKTEKLIVLQARHQKSFDEMTRNVKRMYLEPGYLGSKALFKMVDKSSNEMKSIRSGCTSLLASVRKEARRIDSNTSFNEKQKEELLDSAGNLAQGCVDLSSQLDHAIDRLGEAYNLFPKWSRIHKTYVDLQGEDKAKEVIKANVEDYLESFTTTPEETADNSEEEGKEPENEDAFE